MTRLPTPNLALNAQTQQTGPTGSARGLALNLADAKAPAWSQLLPAGPAIEGRDGRHWVLDPERVMAAFAANNGPLVIDWEHATQLAAPGAPAPAAGWIEEIENRNGELWGRTDWTPKAAEAIAAREYRFLSPAFTFDPETLEVGALVCAALVNTPNLAMAALNHIIKEQIMLKVIAALGLAAGATEDQIVAALNAQKSEHEVALNAAKATAQKSSLETSVPRADYDLALNRAIAAEGKLSAQDAATRDAEIAREVDAAVAAGKVSPATKDYHALNCKNEGGLEAFRKFVAASPSVFAKSDLDKKDADAKGDATALNAEQKKLAVGLGVDEKAFAAYVATLPAA
jgi:phage I-like protein